MKRQFTICAAVICLLLAGLAQGSITVATFADPAADSTTPLFNVDFASGIIKSLWGNGNMGLDLKIAEHIAPYEDVWFTISSNPPTSSLSLNISAQDTFWGMKFGKTGAGIIKFYEHNATVDPILMISFDEAYITPSSFGAGEKLGPVSPNIKIYDYTDMVPQVDIGESFSFGFVNINGNATKYDATSSFSLSAVPEPTTIALLSIGALSLIRKRKISI
jgi:hypothetical protein